MTPKAAEHQINSGHKKDSAPDFEALVNADHKIVHGRLKTKRPIIEAGNCALDSHGDPCH